MVLDAFESHSHPVALGMQHGSSAWLAGAM